MKKKPNSISDSPTILMGPFSERLEGDDGQTAMQATDEVSEALEGEWEIQEMVRMPQKKRSVPFSQLKKTVETPEEKTGKACRCL